MNEKEQILRMLAAHGGYFIHTGLLPVSWYKYLDEKVICFAELDYNFEVVYICNPGGRWGDPHEKWGFATLSTAKKIAKKFLGVVLTDYAVLVFDAKLVEALP